LSNLLHQFVWIAFLQARPQDLPGSRSVLWVAIAVNLITYTLAVASRYPIGQSVLIALTDLTFSALFLFVMLLFVDKGARFQQSLAALCGATAVLNLAATPVMWISAGSATPSFGLVDLCVILWGLAIIGHVLQHALELPRWASIGLAVMFYIVVMNFIVAFGVTRAENTPNQLSGQQLSIYQPVTNIWSSKALG